MGRIRLQGITKRFDRVEAVRGVTLNVEDGEFLVLVGPSGCGKSTVLRMIAGLEDVTEGDIYINDRLVTYEEPRNRDVAMVFQNYALYPHMSVMDNISFCLKMAKVRKPELHAKVLEVARILQLEQLLDRKPNQLSGGQRQRVALGRAMVRNPAAFLMDEPLSNLDANLRIEMRKELLALHERLGKTVIYVTHDQVEAMTMGSRIVVLKDGLIQQVGPPRQVYGVPANTFVATFIGSPAMNLVQGRIGSEGGQLLFTSSGISVPLPGRLSETVKRHAPSSAEGFTLGVRPEDIHVCCATPDNGGHLQGRLDLLEPIGSDVFVHFAVGEEQLLARMDGSFDADKHCLVYARLNPDKIYLFDQEGKNVLHT